MEGEFEGESKFRKRQDVPVLVAVDETGHHGVGVGACADEEQDDEEEGLEVEDCGLEGGLVVWLIGGMDGVEWIEWKSRAERREKGGGDGGTILKGAEVDGALFDGGGGGGVGVGWNGLGEV